jgi:hypothetical protein
MDRRQYGIDGDARVDYGKPLPAPFAGRPRLGTRLYVKGNARRILKPLLKELGTYGLLPTVPLGMLCIILPV